MFNQESAVLDVCLDPSPGTFSFVSNIWYIYTLYVITFLGMYLVCCFMCVWNINVNIDVLMLWKLYDHCSMLRGFNVLHSSMFVFTTISFLN
jgi:hypothetical protein